MGNRLRSRGGAAALALVAACLAAGAAAGARAAPAAGRFLVATRQQQGFFAGTVILLIDYGPHGALGLVVNKPTKVPLETALPGVKEIRGQGYSLYLGGPVSLDHLTLLIRSKTPPERAMHVVDDVYASGSMKVLRALAGDKAEGARFRAYAGYAGWGAGQLDRELSHGDWIVVPASAAAVFTADPARLWRTLIGEKSQQVVMRERRALLRL